MEFLKDAPGETTGEMFATICSWFVAILKPEVRECEGSELGLQGWLPKKRV